MSKRLNTTTIELSVDITQTTERMSDLVVSGSRDADLLMLSSKTRKCLTNSRSAYCNIFGKQYQEIWRNVKEENECCACKLTNFGFPVLILCVPFSYFKRSCCFQNDREREGDCEAEGKTQRSTTDPEQHGWMELGQSAAWQIRAEQTCSTRL